MSEEIINPKKLRRAAAQNEIDSLAALARLVPCSRPAIYLWLKKPTRFPRVGRRIRELVNV